MGRPTLLTDQIKELILNSARVVYHYKWIAASVGIDEKTLQRWREADPDFDDQLNQARSDFINKNMRKAKPEFLLETADREIFGRKEQVNVSLDFRDKVIATYGEIEEGKINEVPRPDEIEGNSSQGSP